MSGVFHICEAMQKLGMGEMPFLKNYDIHVGEYKMSSRSIDYKGWLLCDGRSLQRSDYPELFEIIGTSFGSVDADTFNLPDFRGRAIGIVGHGPGLTNRPMGTSIGSETHTLTSSEMPSHTHTATTSTAGAHNHGGVTGSDGTHTHTSNATGGTVGLATADGTNTVVEADASPNELNVWTTPTSLTINSAGAHTHTIASGGDHTHTVTVNSTGSGLAHNNMQPTLFGCHMFIYAGDVGVVVA